MDRLLQQLIENTADAILVADRQGLFRFWNLGAERMFGHTAAEAVGQSLDLIIPEKLRARHWEGYFRVMASGRTRFGADPLTPPGVRKDGTRVSLEFSIVLLRDEAGNMEGCAAIMRDVTARWQREKELKERLAACEGKGQAAPTRGQSGGLSCKPGAGTPGIPGRERSAQATWSDYQAPAPLRWKTP